jgi:hypothetical protein
VQIIFALLIKTLYSKQSPLSIISRTLFLFGPLVLILRSLGEDGSPRGFYLAAGFTGGHQI